MFFYVSVAEPGSNYVSPGLFDKFYLQNELVRNMKLNLKLGYYSPGDQSVSKVRYELKVLSDKFWEREVRQERATARVALI